MIKVLIVDDHAIVREGLKQILADIPDMEVFGEAGSGDEALKLIRGEGWGIMLLDIAMRGKNVLELIKLAKHQSPHLPILVLSMYPEDQYAIRMLRAGADGYLTKESAPEQLVAAIRKVAKGGKYISMTMTEKLIAELNPYQEKPLHATLTDREFQVFCGICAGKSITDLAQHMALSVKTISTYRARLMKKMNMSKNAEIIHYAFKNDLLD
ncbi:MAG: response regulator transcription factor [Methylobacter sp.]|jgi:DNA-binding NarL/FixJ family response regulator